jgi:hypothetical protein
MRNLISIAALSVVAFAGCDSDLPVAPSATPVYRNQLDFVAIETPGALQACLADAERKAQNNRGPVPMPDLGAAPCRRSPSRPAGAGRDRAHPRRR